MENKTLSIILAVFALILLINLLRTFLGINSKVDLLAISQNKLEEAVSRNKELKRNLARAESRDYVEKQIRDKLNRGKDGEIILIMPSISPYLTPTPTPIDNSPNWQKWVKLYL